MKAIKKEFSWKSYFLLIAFVVLTIILVVVGYSLEWTGFGQYNTQDNVERAKTLWDWLDMIIAPVILALVGIAINSTIKHNESKREEKRAEVESKLAEDQMREDRLQSFLDKMGDLLADNKLYDENNYVYVNIARTRTLTTLRQLDSKRKSILLNFLIELGLVNNINGTVIIDLSGADLAKIELHDANLEGAKLEEANLQGATLDHCNLTKSFLKGTNLKSSKLSYCIFEQAKFKADDSIYDAREKKTDFSGANLNASSFNNTDLTDAIFDENTILPDANTRWSPNFKLESLTGNNECVSNRTTDVI